MKIELGDEQSLSLERKIQMHQAREAIIDRYVFLTAGSCGPCRFGMYEAEYRLALQNAGFDGFRVLLFNQGDGVHAATGESGLKFTVKAGENDIPLALESK